MGPAFLVWSVADEVEECSCAHTGPATIRRRRATRPDSTSRHSDRRNRPLMIYPLKFEFLGIGPHTEFGWDLPASQQPQELPAARWAVAIGHPGSSSRFDGDKILDAVHPRGRPGLPRGLLLFSPRAHGASQSHLATVHLDGDPMGVHLGAALERLLDLGLDLAWRNSRLDRDQVAHPHDAGQVANGVIGGRPLILPL